MERRDRLGERRFVAPGESGQLPDQGKQVYVEGRLQTRSYDDKDGKKQYMTEVVAEDVILLGGRGGEGGDDSRTRRVRSRCRAARRARPRRPSRWIKGSPTTTFRFDVWFLVVSSYPFGH